MTYLPKISIVVPVYKVKKEYLDDCVSSLLNQTYTNLQIILVDDCSPDSCGELCEQYKLKDSRIEVAHHEVNKGLPSARNTGIELVKGDWVTFLDSDDWFDLNTFETLVSYLNSWNDKPDTIIFSGYKNYIEREEKSFPVFEGQKWFKGKQEIKNLLARSFTYFCKDYPTDSLNLDSACWKLISKELFDKGLRFIDVPFREDGLFFLYLTEASENIVCISDTFYHYRTTSTSMSNSFRKNAPEEHRMYLNEVWKCFNNFKTDEDLIDLFYYQVLSSMQLCVHQYFFHPQLELTKRQKKKLCKKYFSEFPYCNVFKKIKLRKLRRNHFIKAVLIKMRMYGMIEFLRKFVNKKSY